VTLALLVAALAPVVGAAVLQRQRPPRERSRPPRRFFLAAIAAAAFLAVVLVAWVGGSIGAQLRTSQAASTGSSPATNLALLPLPPIDDLGRLAERQHELALELGRRNRGSNAQFSVARSEPDAKPQPDP